MNNIFIKLKILSLLLITNTIFAKNRQWVYFDLGNTIINTHDQNGFRFYKGSLDYLHALKTKDYKIGLISNIPESFGQDHEQKLATLKEFIASKWVDHQEMDWDLFDEIILPLKNEELKPAEIMYQKAIEKAQFCKLAYISENVKEVLKANELGIAGHLYLEDDTVEYEKLYIPLDRIENFIKLNSNIRPPNGMPEC